ncbi:hypothetical protein DEO72_LG5g898 [Vigna unguiculata]|uniref:Uncharacterized protein n=1 Tax=Vigna unguiculata TaxID=3917 RepID=A0A4D6LUU1_VIGUN|nr:hypothetical protein DEO72_LG5g898 [Vigna unguiculata]
MSVHPHHSTKKFSVLNTSSSQVPFLRTNASWKEPLPLRTNTLGKTSNTPYLLAKTCKSAASTKTRKQQLLPAHQNPARVSPLPAHQNPLRALHTLRLTTTTFACSPKIGKSPTRTCSPKPSRSVVFLEPHKHNSCLFNKTRQEPHPYLFTKTSGYLKVSCCHTYRPQPIEHMRGNLSGPIRTGHNQHTHIGNTRQPELNSRVPRVHPPSRAQLEGCHSELNSRNATWLTPIPSSTQGIRSELNSRNTSKPTFKIS